MIIHIKILQNHYHHITRTTNYTMKNACLVSSHQYFSMLAKKDMHYHTKRKAHESLIMQLYQLYKCKLSLTTRNIRFKIPAFDVQNSNPTTTLYYFAFQDDYSFLDDQRNFLNIYLDILLCVIGSLFPAIPWNMYTVMSEQCRQA